MSHQKFINIINLMHWYASWQNWLAANMTPNTRHCVAWVRVPHVVGTLYKLHFSNRYIIHSPAKPYFVDFHTTYLLKETMNVLPNFSSLRQPIMEQHINSYEVTSIEIAISQLQWCNFRQKAMQTTNVSTLTVKVSCQNFVLLKWY